MAILIKDKGKKSKAVGYANVVHPDGSEEHNNHDIPEWSLVEDTTHLFEVRYEAHFTKNMGNYESTRVGVGIRAPANYQGLDEAFKFCEDWVDDRMVEVLKDIEDS
jgi:hypothetical protein